jgi:hypothetical protein
MPSAIGLRFALSLGPHGAQLALRSGLWRPRFELLESLVWPAQTGEAQRAAHLPPTLDALLLRHAVAGSALEVLVADVWAPSASVQPPAKGATLADLQAATALRLRAVTDAASGWECASEPRVGGPFMASALRSGVLDLLRDQCQRHRLHLVSVQPLFAAVWNHWHGALAPGQWLGICSAGVLTLCVAPKRHVAHVRRLDFAAAHAQEARWPLDAAKREGLRLGVAAPSALVLCGAVPAPWRNPVPAALGARRGPSAAYLGPVGDALGLWGLQP